MPQAIALITSGPADIVGLADRGRIAAGLRADLVQVRLFNGHAGHSRRLASGQAHCLSPYRVAVYYAPAADDPLWARGCTWLGRDPETGVELPQPDIDGIAAQVTEPRRYGFHATLKPPMQLTGTLDQFLRDVKRLCRELEAVCACPVWT